MQMKSCILRTTQESNMRKLTYKRSAAWVQASTLIQECQKLGIIVKRFDTKRCVLIRFQTMSDKCLYMLVGSIKPSSMLHFVSDKPHE